MVCGFWSIFSWEHFFLGGFRFLETQKKIQASHVQLIQDEAGVWESPAFGLVPCGRKKAHDTPAKIKKCLMKRDHLQL